MIDPAPPPLVLSRRLGLHPSGRDSADPLVLVLTAEERSRLRGLRHSPCGLPLLLQLPRGEALQPGEWLAASDDLARVRVDAAAEPLLVVRTDAPLALLRAAYHLGNRHVALEVRAGELRLLADPVLEDLLRQRGLAVHHAHEPFQPEPGAYGGATGHTHPAAHLASPSAGTGIRPRDDA